MSRKLLNILGKHHKTLLRYLDFISSDIYCEEVSVCLHWQFLSNQSHTGAKRTSGDSQLSLEIKG